MGHWVLLILDTCGSRLGARHVSQRMGDLPNTVVIGTAESRTGPPSRAGSSSSSPRS